MPWTIPLSDLNFGPEAQQAVHNVLASKWLSMGEMTATLVHTHVMQHLAPRGIQTSIHYPPMHQFTFYQKLYQISPISLPKTEAVGGCQMTLSLYAEMTEDQVDYVCTCVVDALQKP
jgi:dTDP-4-amino-4,6-dideoxygalactose transaminase